MFTTLLIALIGCTPTTIISDQADGVDADLPTPNSDANVDTPAAPSEVCTIVTKVRIGNLMGPEHTTTTSVVNSAGHELLIEEDWLSDGTVDTRYESVMNADGQPTETTIDRHTDGLIDERHTFAYANGLLVEHTQDQDGDGTLDKKLLIDNDECGPETIAFLHDDVLKTNHRYTYNQDCLELSRVYEDPSGNTELSIISTWDADGNQLTGQGEGADGEFFSLFTVTIGANGMPIERIYTDVDGNVTRMYEYAYPTSTRRLETHYPDYPSQETRSLRETFDSDDRIIERLWWESDSDNELVETSTYAEGACR
jgi:hypothetical protein